MSKKKQSKKDQPATLKSSPSAESAPPASPYLAAAHPPAKNPTLLAVSAILFVVWFLFLLLAAISG
ncbi:MAG: hypothetical protein K8R36_14700 [Planctomycetales bacterium]|nr:hypothetical protein [Planctomycetales bacterium]